MPPFPTLQETAGLIVKGLGKPPWYLNHAFNKAFFPGGGGIQGKVSVPFPAQKRFLYSLSSIIMVQLKTAKYLKRRYYWRYTQFFMKNHKGTWLYTIYTYHISNTSQTLFFPHKTQRWLTNTICTTCLHPTNTIFTADFVLNRVALANPVFQWRPERDGTSIQLEKK